MLKWLFILPGLLVALIIGLSIYLQPNDFIGCGDTPLEGTPCHKVDAIAVVSGGDTNARTDEGIRMYQNGWASALVFAGAAQDKTGLSNAAAMKLRAMQAGVPERVIYIDEFSETTEQNAQNSQTIFESHDFKEVMLITSGYHQRRANLEFEKRANTIKILNHPLLNDKDWSFWWWLTPRGWWLAGGETAKIIAFYTTGTAQ